ncbi:MAG: hypothetical protein RLP44_02335 [Aggregatilineales bacterium]
MLVFIVSACAVTEKPALDLPPLTLLPPPTPVFEGMCDDNPRILEGWLQTVDFQERDFVALMNGTVSRSSEELYFDVEQMARLRDRVASAIVPDCAEEAHLLLLEIMGDVLVVYQSAVNGEEINITTVIDENLPRFQSYELLQDELLQRLNG